MRIADELVRGVPLRNSAGRSDAIFARLLPRTQRFILDNVATYWAESPQLYWGPDGFPNAAPPFPVCWFEYAAPTRLVAVEGVRDNLRTGPDATAEDVGVFASAHDQSTEPVLEALGCRTESPATWVWELHVILRTEPGWAAYAGAAFMAVSSDGTILPMLSTTGGSYLQIAIAGTPWADPHLHVQMIQQHLHPVLLGLSFLHCKNVMITDPHRDAKHDRAARRRGDPEGLTYHRLIIEPMQKILRQAAEDAGAPGDLKVALHIMRGHFKRYEQGRGLFGKLHGMWFWESQVRGTAQAGRVVKDYDVRPPRSSGGEER
jgi:hypothetical protein